MVQPVKVGLLGCGVVGSAVARQLIDDSTELAQRVGAPLELIGVAVRDTGKARPESGVPAELFTDDATSLVERADLVIELMGGIDPAKSLLLKAIEHGASVVPLTMPITRCTSSPASDSRRGRNNGIAPATDASNDRSTPR